MGDSIATSHQSAVALIERLPPELVLEIIQHCALEKETRTWDLRRLSNVCRAWASLIEAAPSLWTSISTSDPQYLRSLIRSKHHPIHVSYYDSDAQKRDTIPFIRAVCDNSSRWSSVKIAIEDAASVDTFVAIQRLADLQVPILEELEIEIDFDLDNHVDIFDGEAPKLERVSLIGFPIPFHSSLFSSLRYLTLMYWEDGPPPWRTVGILADCPGLIELSLSYCSADGYDLPDDGTPLPLHSLESITLDMEPFILTHLLTRIRIPNCKRFERGQVGGWLQEGDSMLFLPEMEHLGPIFKRAAASCVTQEIRIKFDNSYFEYWTREGGEYSVHVTFMCSVWGSRDLEKSALRFLSHIPMDSASSPITLWLDTPPPDEFNDEAFEPLVSIFEARVESLICQAQDPHPPARSFIYHLSVPYAAPGGWPFPNLRTLTIQSQHSGQMITSAFLSKIEKLVRNRSSPQDATDSVPGACGLPAKLEKLIFAVAGTKAVPDEVRVLKDLVGTVWWDDIKLWGDL